MNKRVSINERRANEAKGMDVIFGAQPSAGSSKELPSSEDRLSQQPKVPTSELPSAIQNPNDPQLATPKVVKATLYVRPDQIESIEEIQLAQRRRSGTRPDKSALVQEALDLVIQKYRNELGL